MQNSLFPTSFISRLLSGLIGLLLFVAATGRTSFGQTGVPGRWSMLHRREPRAQATQQLWFIGRTDPVDASISPARSQCRDLEEGPSRRPHQHWASEARECVRRGLHYDLPPVDLKARTLARVESDTFFRETIEFNTTPWFRVPGYFYIPKNVTLPAPALLVLHEWGGPMLFRRGSRQWRARASRCDQAPRRLHKW